MTICPIFAFWRLATLLTDKSILCPVQELMSAALGVGTGSEASRVAKRTGPPRLIDPPVCMEHKSLNTPSFAVTQALVGLLAQTGGTGLTRDQSYAENMKGGHWTMICKIIILWL